MAVMMGISRPNYQIANEAIEISQPFQTTLLAHGIVYSILASVAITVTAYGIAWRPMGLIYFNQPGHWLMVEIAVATVLGLIVQLAYQMSGGMPSTGPVEMSWIVSVALTLASLGLVVFRVAFNIYIGAKKCAERRWSWVFYLKAFASIIQVLGDLVFLVMLSRASLIDRRQRLQRGGLHRCGVIIQIALSLLTLTFVVLFMFAFALGWWQIK